MTVYQRNGRYCVAVYVPASQAMDWVGTFATEAEATAAEADAKRGPTIHTFAQRWLNAHPEWTDQTRATYRRKIQAFTAAFGALRLRELTPSAAADWSHDCSQSEWETARAMLNDAVTQGEIAHNPLASIRGSRPPTRGRLSPEDVFDLADISVQVWGSWGETVFAPLLISVAFLGLSQWEVCEAQKRHVKDGFLDVSHSYHAPAYIAMPAEARLAIEIATSASPSDWIFTNKHLGQLKEVRLFHYLDPVRTVFGDRTITYRDIRTAMPPPPIVHELPAPTKT